MTATPPGASVTLRPAAAGVLAAFALNWIWENAQAPLYTGYTGFAQHVWSCTLATFGDVAIVALIFSAVALAWRDAVWHRHASAGHYAVAVLVGAGIAIGIEYWALATDRWTYAEMPTIPHLRIGLLPLLQMMFVPPLVFALMGRVARPAASAAAMQTSDDR